jgi:hypothetical protein
MLGIGFGLVWVGYLYGLYGYCLIKGYNVTAKQLVAPTWPPTTVDAKPPTGSIRALPPKTGP